MINGIVASEMLAHEARALLARLARVKPFVITETMVPAAAVSPRAVTAIERYLATGRRELRARVNAYLKWLATPAARDVPPATLQQRFTFLRSMRFGPFAVAVFFFHKSVHICVLSPCFSSLLAA